MKINFTSQLIGIFGICLLSLACQKETDSSSTESESLPAGPPAAAPRYLYATTGNCYSGNGIATFTAATASNLVMKINTSTGNREQILADYNAAPASGGDTPISVVDWDETHLLVLVGSGTSGRIETLPKSGGTRANFGLSPGPGTILATAPRAMSKTSDGGLLILRTGFIERINSSGIRLGSPWVNNVLQVTCSVAGGNTVLTSVTTSAASSNRIIATHAVTGANRTISLAATGANTTAGCAAAQAAPVATGTPAFPTATVFDPNSGKLLVAYGANNANAEANSIYAYDFNESTGAISNGQKIYDANAYPGTHGYLLFGISAMTLDKETNELYVATAISNAATAVNYAIEKFNFDSSKIGTENSSVLSRVGSTPFYNYGIDTKCISSLTVGN